MMKFTHIALSIATMLLSGCITAETGSEEDEKNDFLHEINKNWSFEYSKAYSEYVFSSPAYPLEYNQGCVVHRQHMPLSKSGINYSLISFSSIYYPKIRDHDCATVNRSLFFAITGSTHINQVLNFVKKIHDGPVGGRDEYNNDQLSMLNACFSNKELPRVLQAVAREEDDGFLYEFFISLECKLLPDGKEIHVTGFESSEKLSWKIRDGEYNLSE